jgi:calpain-7
MKALKLSSDQDERKLLKAQCGEIMNVADRIKKTVTWTPPANSQQTDTKNNHTGQWAAQVAVTANPASAFEDATTQSNSSRHGFSSPLMSDSSYQDNPNVKASNGFNVDNAPNSNVRPSPRPYPASAPSQSAISHSSRAAPSPAAESQSQIYRLREPASSRQLSKREEIILLKASMVNGFKFPPWTKDPPADEFASHHGDGHFTDVGDLSLSPYQQQFFQDWLPAKEAIPPPSLSPNRQGVVPLMSSSKPLDLVQDAASDCSVVTSLCAGIARSERGHDQVRLLNPR